MGDIAALDLDDVGVHDVGEVAEEAGEGRARALLLLRTNILHSRCGGLHHENRMALVATAQNKRVVEAA